jgi:hypothetical protein
MYLYLRLESNNHCEQLNEKEALMLLISQLLQISTISR